MCVAPNSGTLLTNNYGEVLSQIVKIENNGKIRKNP